VSDTRLSGRTSASHPQLQQDQQKVPPALAAAVLDRARAMIEDAVDRMKTEAGDVTLIAVRRVYVLAR
jgi:hypothetical protein